MLLGTSPPDGSGVKKHFWLGLVLALGATLSACAGGGGGGAAGPPAPHPSGTTGPQVKPTPTATPLTILGHVFIGIGKKKSELVPQGGQPYIPPGAVDGGPLANAIVIYPDGSKQIADPNGRFVPSQSSYAISHKNLLASSAQAQPQIIMIDPTGASSPIYATIPAYGNAAGLITQSVQRSGQARGAQAATLITGQTTNLAGITILPQQASMLSNDLLYVSVLGTDANNNVVDLSGSTITWSANSGTVVPFTNPTAAYYVPPSITAGGTNDSVNVAVAINGNPNNVFYAAFPVSVLAPASAATLTGTVTAAATPVPNALAVFSEAGPSQLFAPTLWLAQADSSGNYTAQVPAQTKLGLGVGVDVPYSPSGSYGVFLAQQPNLTNAYTSGASGSTATLPLLLDPSGIPFSFTSAYDSGSVPSYVSFVRNAWYGAHEAVIQRIFEANSGIQSLLASAPASVGSPAAASPLPSGQFSRWCYQWQTIAGAVSLVLAENTASTCTQPGNDAYVITPNGGGSYSYVRYASTAVYSLSGTIDVITNSVLVESGTWSQSTTSDASGNITSDQVSDTGGFYDVNNQVVGSPAYSETLSYQYTLGSNGLATETFTNDTRVSSFTGTTISVVNAQSSQTAPYTPSGCLSGGPVQCFTISGTEQADVDGSGILDGSFTISDRFNGDGSGQLVFQTTTTGDASKIVLPLAASVSGNAQSCIVCAGNLGQLYDKDGITDLGTIQIDNTLLTKVVIYDTPPGQSTLGPDVIDSFGFVL